MLAEPCHCLHLANHQWCCIRVFPMVGPLARFVFWRRPSVVSRESCDASALGQKQTFAPQEVMSALPPKADMCRAQSGPSIYGRVDLSVTTDNRAYRRQL